MNSENFDRRMQTRFESNGFGYQLILVEMKSKPLEQTNFIQMGMIISTPWSLFDLLYRQKFIGTEHFVIPSLFIHFKI